MLKAAPETQHVRAATEADRPAIVAAYTAKARRYRGPVERTEQQWNQVLNSTDKEFQYTYVYEQNGSIEGYITYRGGNRDGTRLREAILLIPGARRALLGLLRRHEMQIDTFRWDAPCDDPLWSTLMHWEVKTTLRPNTQARNRGPARSARRLAAPFRCERRVRSGRNGRVRALEPGHVAR